MVYEKKFKQFTKKEQAEIEDIDYFGGYWYIILKNHDRVLSEDKWSEVKWELKEIVRRNDFELEW